MKFTAGYILGGATVIAVLGGVAAGALGTIYSLYYLDEKKNDAADKVKETPTGSALASYLFKNRN